MDPLPHLVRLHTAVEQALAHTLALVRRRAGARDERGDVPGWVLITVMTITIGMGLWGIAKPELTHMLRSALNSVK